MDTLLQAAKAVIYCWDDPEENFDMRIDALRAAVEQTENVPTEFEEYWITQGFVAEERQTVLTIWTDAQRVERERVLGILHDNRDVFSEGGLCLLVEKIDLAEREDT